LRFLLLSGTTLPSDQRSLHLGRVRKLDHPTRGGDEQAPEKHESENGNPPVVAGKERADSDHGEPPLR